MVPKSLALRLGRLCYSGEGQIKSLDPKLLLDRFVSLGRPGSRDEEILEFAKRYGPLYLCKAHGMVSYHKPLLMSFSALGPPPIFGVDEPFKYEWCWPTVECQNPRTLSESLEKWRALATRANNLLRVATAVRRTGEAPRALWEELDGFTGSFAQRDGASWAYLDEPWSRLAANLEYWIVAADVCVQVGTENQDLVALLGSNPFTYSSFGLIAIQLLLAATRSEGLASCSGCGAPYICGRPPLVGKQVGLWTAKRSYCQNCRATKVPQRDAARDYRKRRSAAK